MHTCSTCSTLYLSVLMIVFNLEHGHDVATHITADKGIISTGMTLIVSFATYVDHVVI